MRSIGSRAGTLAPWQVKWHKRSFEGESERRKQKSRALRWCWQAGRAGSTASPSLGLAQPQAAATLVSAKATAQSPGLTNLRAASSSPAPAVPTTAAAAACRGPRTLR